jgi:hypothetical protein
LGATTHLNPFFYFFVCPNSAFTINSIIKYAGIAIGASGLIITLLAVLNAEVNNKNAQTIQPRANLTRATSTASAQKSAFESERY